MDLYLIGLTALSLGSGTFDLIIEGKRQYLAEIKKVSYNMEGEYDPFRKGIIFSKNQTKTISHMKYPPIIIAYDYYENTNYLILPDKIINEFPIFPDEHKAEIYVNSRIFSRPMDYCTLLNKLYQYCTN